MTERRPPDRQALDWLCRAIGPGTTVVGTAALIGGISAAMDRVELRSGGASRTVVLRRWRGRADYPTEFVTREATVLTALGDQRIDPDALVAPALIAADPTGQHAGAPALAMTHVPGQVDLAPTDPHLWVRRLARQQAVIHALAATPTYRDPEWWNRDGDRGWITDPGLRAEATAAAALPPEASCFVHGDYQHFNVLWTEGRISAVVDWPSAGMGDPGFDVGHCRLNLATLFSPDLAEAHLRHYEAITGSRLGIGGQVRALLGWSTEWQQFLPVQVAGRAPVDPTGMPDRVTRTIRATLDRA